MNQFLTLYFFTSIWRFYAWVFPLNVMVSVSMLLGLAVGLLSRRRSWLRRGFVAVCLVILAAAEIVSQLFTEESLMWVSICGWFAEAALLCCCIGMAVRYFWRKFRER